MKGLELLGTLRGSTGTASCTSDDTLNHRVYT